MRKLSVLIFIFLSACTSVRINHVSQIKKINKNTYVYTLPKTVIGIEITVKKIIFVPGPYSSFAEKYLGIEQADTNNYTNYYFENISINSLLKADSGHVYVVQYKNRLPWKSIVQRSDGVILSVNCPKEEITNTPYSTDISYVNNYKSLSDDMYLEMSKTGFIKERTDTTYKQIRIDTNWVRVPVTKKVSEAMTMEEKAKEAAELIMDLRQRRYDLFSGDYEMLPQGEAATSIANELNAQEEKYLSLFVGKYFESYQTFYIELEPTNPYQKNYMVAYFGKKSGLTIDSVTKDAKPIVLSVNLNDAWLPYSKMLLKYQKAKQVNAFTYRMPQKTQVTLLYDYKKLYEKEIELYQFGKRIYMPVSFLKNHSFRLDNPDYIIIQ